jgi:hypothetical protein
MFKFPGALGPGAGMHAVPRKLFARKVDPGVDVVIETSGYQDCAGYSDADPSERSGSQYRFVNTTNQVMFVQCKEWCMPRHIFDTTTSVVFGIHLAPGDVFSHDAALVVNVRL